MSIYTKLALIQNELIAPKGQTNSFGNYNYRSCEDIVKALKPLCEKNNCVVYMSNDLVSIGNRFYVKAEVKFVDLESGESIESVAHAREEENKKGMDGSQITGASSSYARKYALAGLFCIDNEKDSDATNHGEEPDTITETMATTIKNLADEMGVDISLVLARYKLEKLEDLKAKNYKAVMDALKKSKKNED